LLHCDRLDFTKQYNRLRQKLLPNKSTNTVASAPAANQPTKARLAKKTAASQHSQDDDLAIGDQIEALSSKFGSRIHLGEQSTAQPVAELKMGSKKAAGDRY
jgi:hypothetical protein